MKTNDIVNMLREDPQAGDTVFIEAGETLIETVIEDVLEDGVLLKLDERAIEIINEGIFDRLKNISGNVKANVDNRIAKDALESLGYIVGLASAMGFDTVQRALSNNEFLLLAKALKLAQHSPRLRAKSSMVGGINTAKKDVEILDSNTIARVIKLKFEKLHRGISYLESVANDPDQMPTDFMKTTRYGELDEGWRSKAAALGAAGVIGAGAALSPSTTVSGVKHYMSPSAPKNVDAKIVVDDNGKRVYVWMHRDVARKQREPRYYPVDKVNESDARYPLGKPEPMGSLERQISDYRSQIAAAIRSGHTEQAREMRADLEELLRQKKSSDKLDEAKYQGRTVSLGKPFLTPDGPKKRSVYVKNAKGNVVKVNFGDKNMRIKKGNPSRRKSFRARHNCANPGPRWRARYWSCRAW